MYVAHTINLYKNVGAAYGSNINYVTKPQPFSLQNHNYPQSSPPPSSSSAMCEIDTRFEIFPLISFPLQESPQSRPCGRAAWLYVNSGLVWQFKPVYGRSSNNKAEGVSTTFANFYTHPICSSIAQITQPGINSLVVASQLIDVRPVFILQ